MIDRHDITDEYSVKCVFILNTDILIDAALHISLRNFWKCHFFMILFIWPRSSEEDQMYNQPWTRIWKETHLLSDLRVSDSRLPPPWISSTCNLWFRRYVIRNEIPGVHWILLCIATDLEIQLNSQNYCNSNSLFSERLHCTEIMRIIWAASSEFVSSSIPSWHILTAHAQPFRGARDLAFWLKVPLDSLLVWASSGGSGETARTRRLAWTFAARIGDKYQIRLTRPILRCPVNALFDVITQSLHNEVMRFWSLVWAYTCTLNGSTLKRKWTWNCTLPVRMYVIVVQLISFAADKVVNKVVIMIFLFDYRKKISLTSFYDRVTMVTALRRLSVLLQIFHWKDLWKSRLL